MREAQELTDTIEENLAVRSLGTTSVRAELVKVFSELVNNSAEHGMPQGGQPGHAFEAVTVDSGAGIRTALARNPAIPQPEPDAHAIGLAFRSWSPGRATRGIGLWMTVTEMRKPGRKLWLHSGSGSPYMVRRPSPRSGRRNTGRARGSG